MSDLFGMDQPSAHGGAAFVRNTKPLVAQEKAELCLLLNCLVKRPPPMLSTASINTVHRWKADQKSAAKVLAKKDVSRQALLSSINTMQFYVDKGLRNE